MNELIPQREIISQIYFMFQLTITEWKELITNCDNLGAMKFSPSFPYAFTEQGIAMLSGILRSSKAIKINISIMRAFIRMREIIDENKELREKLDDLEARYDEQFRIVFATRNFAGPITRDSLSIEVYQSSNQEYLITFYFINFQTFALFFARQHLQPKAKAPTYRSKGGIP